MSGCEGVLALDAVSDMDQIAAIRQEMRKVTAFSGIAPGQRDGSDDSGTGKAAGYGLAALVAAAAARPGLSGKLSALLLAFTKIILIG